MGVPSAGPLVKSREHAPYPQDILDGLANPAGVSIETLQALDHFTHALYGWEFPSYMWPQIGFCAAYVGLGFIVCAIVMLWRWWKGKLWFFRIMQRAEGMYIVPNALTTFWATIAVYAAMFVAYVCLHFRAYYDHNDAFQKYLSVWNIFCWWPLFLSAIFAVWGSTYTMPGALDRKSAIGKFIPKPFYINIVCFGTPIFVAVCLIPFVVLAQGHIVKAVNLYASFHNDINQLTTKAQLVAAVIGSSNVSAVSPAQGMELLSRADEIWEETLLWAYWSSVAYCIYPAFDAILFISYGLAGGYLNWLMFQQLMKQAKIVKDTNERIKEVKMLRRIEEERKRAEHRAAEAKKLVSSRRNDNYSKTTTDSSQGDLASRQADLSNGEGSTTAHASDTSVQNRLSQVPTNSNDEISLEKPSSAGENATDDNSETAAEQQEFKKTVDEGFYFPVLSMEARTRLQLNMRDVEGVSGGPLARYRYIRRCLINLLIVYLSILFAGCMFMSLSAALGRYFFGYEQRGPTYVADFKRDTHLIVAWISVLFGTLTTIAVFARFLDPASQNGTSSLGGSGGRKEKEDSKEGMAESFNIQGINSSGGAGLSNFLDLLSTTFAPSRHAITTQDRTREGQLEQDQGPEHEERLQDGRRDVRESIIGMPSTWDD